MLVSVKDSPTAIRWSVSRHGRSLEAEVVGANDLWRFRLTASGDVVLQRHFVSWSSACRFWRTIREALAHDGWR
jgi:hypothetical protein